MNSPALQTKRENACELCGLRLPSHPVTNAGGRRFCCLGCAHVSAILDEVGAESEAGRKAVAAARRQGLISSDVPPGPQVGELPKTVREETRLRVEGLSCPSCAWLVESVLATQKGVAEAEVDYLSDTVRVVYDLSKTSEEELASAVAEAGYRLSSLEEEGGKEERRNLLRLALAAFVAMNEMILAWVGYSAFILGSSDLQALLVGWVQLAFALPVITWSAMPLYRRAVAAFTRGRVVMETLLSLGVLAAAALSFYSVLTGSAHTYFETATMLVALSLGAVNGWLHLLFRVARPFIASPVKSCHFCPL